MKTLSSLPTLTSFSAIEQPEPEIFGANLKGNAVEKVVCFSTPELAESAGLYAAIQEISDKCVLDIRDQLPYEEIAELTDNSVVPIFINDATDSHLRHRFFSHPEVIHFIDHNLVTEPNRSSSLKLTTIGTTKHGLEQLPFIHQNIVALRNERSKKMKEALGNDIITYVDFRRYLQSEKAGDITLQALGPHGTNIAQASELYLQSQGLQNKAAVVINNNKVEPMHYAEMAAASANGHNTPLHMECAVYYGMGELFRSRVNELIFADQQYMQLDEMQLANSTGIVPELSRPIKIASHPSPMALVKPWLDTGIAEYIAASSNSDAADMVINGEVDACITTRTSLQTRNLSTVHSFGSPTMMFTIGTPYSMQDILQKLRE